MNWLELRIKCRELIEQPLTIESCNEILTIIKDIGEVDSDDEVAHSLEDEFREAILKHIDHPLAKLALRSSEFNFARRCS